LYGQEAESGIRTANICCQFKYILSFKFLLLLMAAFDGVLKTVFEIEIDNEKQIPL
jgi:hypothetical protein